MKFYHVTTVSNFIRNPEISEFHAAMFHGLAERNGKECPHDPKVWANTPSTTSLMVSRTGRKVPPVFCPSTHFIMHEELAELLRPCPNVRVAPIIFKRLVDVDFQKGDSSWESMWGRGDPLELLRTLPDRPELHHRVGPHCEVQTYRWQDVIDSYPTAQEITIETDTPPFEEQTSLRVGRDLLNDFPLLYYWGGVLLHGSVFAILGDKLDCDFFLVREYKVP